MLPSSHAIPIKRRAVDSNPSPQLLADAFSEFISASAVLEASYRDLQGEVSRLSAELTKRNEALASSLAENERMRAALQQMLDSMPCGVLVLNHAGRIVMINTECRHLLNLGAVSISSLHEVSATSKVDFEALSKGPDNQFGSEICIQTGIEKRWLAISKRKLFCGPAHQPEHLHSIWILRDITANKLAEQEREAARRATALAEISTILAHEIRNPLASMELFADLIEQDLGTSSHWVSHLRAGIRSLSGTVNNVLSLNSESKACLTQVDLVRCVRSGVEFVGPIAEQAGLSLSFHAANDTPSVEGNEEAIRQIVLNIVCNAIRHTETGGSVDVSTRSSIQNGKAVALVEIRDTGCGIADSAIGQIFDAGFSVTGETPGLGLAVCKRLMIQHGGTISASSRIHEGSTFLLEFPAI